MKPLDCAGAEDLFSDHYDGTLPEEARRALEAHLATCPTCRALRDVFGEVVDALHRVRDHSFAPSATLAARASAAAIAASPAPGRRPRPRVRELPVWLQLAAAGLAILVTLGVLGATGALGDTGHFGRLRARTLSTGAYLAERRDRLAEDWRLLRIVIGTTLEGRLDRVQERVDEYRRLLEKRRAQPSPEPERQVPSGEADRTSTNSNSAKEQAVPSSEPQIRRPEASGERRSQS
jgi:Putative zinc-finger